MTNRVPKINIDLTQIADPAARDSLRTVIDFVNDLLSQGITTGGPLAAKTLENDSGFTVDVLGNVSGRSFASHGHGSWQVRKFEGTLAGAAHLDVVIGGRIFGAIGETSVDGSATLFIPIPVGVITNTIYFSTTVGTANTVRIVNDSANANRYRGLVFFST